MTDELMIDVTRDLSLDSGGGDPDRYSATLRAYNRRLWVKPLPAGGRITVASGRRGDLQYPHEGSVAPLSSDTICTSFSGFSRLDALRQECGVELVGEFYRDTNTIGARIVFPSKTVDRRPTINGARGMHPLIADRFDLTLEAIQRHYQGGESPLSRVLGRYRDFFDCFVTFEQYVEFFMLEDHLDSHGRIRFYLDFTGDYEARSPLPRDADEYRSYRDVVIEILRARNRRIHQWSQATPQPF